MELSAVQVDTSSTDAGILSLNVKSLPVLIPPCFVAADNTVDSTSGIIARPQCSSPPLGYALCTISCSLGRKRPATALSCCQSFMMHHSAHVHVRRGWKSRVHVSTAGVIKMTKLPPEASPPQTPPAGVLKVDFLFSEVLSEESFIFTRCDTGRQSINRGHHTGKAVKAWCIAWTCKTDLTSAPNDAGRA